MSFSWSASAGSADIAWLSATDVLNPTVTLPGSYSSSATFTLTVTQGSCPSSSQDYVIGIITPPLDLGPDVNFDCTTPNIELSTNGYNSSYEYAWSPITDLYTNSAGTTAHSGAFSIFRYRIYASPTTTTTYTITMRDSETECFYGTDDITVTVPTTIAIDAGADIIYCLDAGAVAIAASGTGNTFTWTATGYNSDPYGFANTPSAGEETTMLGYLSNTAALSINFNQASFTPGKYVYTLTAADGACSTSDELVVIVPDMGTTALAGISTSVCEGGSVALGVENPSAQFIYFWRALNPSSQNASISDPSSPTPTVNPSVTTTYELTYIDGLTGCTNTETVTVSITPKPTIADVDMAVQCAPVGTIDLTAQIPSYGTYFNPVWYQNSVPGTVVSTPTSVSPTQTTDYFLILENEFGCPDTSKITVNITNVPISCSFTNTVNATCATSTDGSFIVLASSSDPIVTNFEYSIDGTNWQTSPSFTGVLSGSYTVQVRNADVIGSCPSYCTVTLECVNQIEQFGDITYTGDANSSSTGGDDPQHLAGPIESAGTATNGNTVSGNVTLINNTNTIAVLQFDEILPIGLEVTISMAKNNAAGEATISDGNMANDITFNSGTEDELQHITFTISQATNQLVITRISGSVWVDGAEYNDTVNQSIGFVCDACPPCTNPTADAPTTVQGTCAGATANNNATITLSNITNADIAGIVAGADYTSGVAYNADANTDAALEAVAANTVTFSGLTHNTQYTVRVFNAANDCFTDFVVTSANIIIPAIVLGTTVNPTTCSGTDGTIQITGMTASTAYTLNFMKDGVAQTAQNITSDASGNFIMTGLDAAAYTAINVTAAGCTSNDVTATLTDPSGVTLVTGTTVNPTTCLGTDGTIQITGMAISTAYTLNFMKDGVAQTAQNITSDASGNFIMTGLDAAAYTAINVTAAGCTSNDVTATLNDPSTVTLVTGTTVNPTTCSGTDGTIQITGMAASTAYTLNFMKDAAAQTAQNITSDASGNFIITGLDAAAYTAINVTAAGCVSNSVTATLADPTSGTIMTIPTAETCALNDGSIQITITGGSTPFDISWDDSNGNSGNSLNEPSPFLISSLPAGTYSITVVDNIGCSLTTSETVTAPSACCASITNPTAAQSICDGQNITSLEVNTDATSSIDFVYFTTAQTGNNMYSSGTSLGVATPSGGTASISNVSFPAAGIYYVYAILSPTPADGTCRPFQEIMVSVNPLPNITYILTDTTVCTETDAVLILSSSEIGFNYQLRNDADDSLIGTPVAGTGNSISFTISNLSPAGTYTYNVLATHSTAGCNSEITDKAIIEVEGCDFQDYLPTCANPPCHFTSADLYIGSGVSSEASTMGTINADTDDDDGILIPNNIRPSITIRFPTTIYNNTGQTAYLTGWIDWNGDQDFDDPGEQIANEIYDFATYNGSFQVPITIAVPSDAVQGQSIAVRYRLSTVSADINSPCGFTACAADGEIEDYLIQIECPPIICLPVNVTINRNE